MWWIGIGLAGTLISAILLLLKQDWRTSINRFAEAMTLFAVACAALFLGYDPYAQPIARYASFGDLYYSFGPFFLNTYGLLDVQFSDVWLVRMFWPSIWGAVMALAVALVLWLVSRRQRPGGEGLA